MKDKVLYITYDGLTDPLGQSQVLPYIMRLALRSYRFTLLSFEKPEHTDLNNTYGILRDEYHIGWHSISYTKKPPVISTMWDIYRMKRLALKLHRQHSFALVHCRSYIAAFAGLYLKRKFGVRFIFDMRGFWADERIEGGIWNKSNPLFFAVYRYFKRKEKEYLLAADYTITLSEKAKDEIHRRPGLENIPIKVIPCCTDTGLFNRERLTPEGIEVTRTQLGLDRKNFVITYLGAIGTWYMLDEMLDFFRLLLQKKPEARFLFITPEPASSILKAAAAKGLAPENIITVKAKRHEVPYLLSLTDLGIYFIRPTYSKIASSPTKLAELLSMGIPVITNKGVGDSDRILEASGCGLLVKDFSERAYTSVISGIDGILKTDREHIRKTALEHFSLEMGTDRYAEVYQSLTGDHSQ
jgi:glycosyltransferase involved in cell wall biosynthesis